MRSSENPPNWNTETISTYGWWPTGKQSEDFIKTAIAVEQILTGRRIVNSDSISNSILYLGIESLLRNENKKVIGRIEIRKIIRRILGLKVSDATIYRFKNLVAQFLNLKALDDRWIPVKEVLKSLSTDEIDFSEECLMSIVPLILRFK